MRHVETGEGKGCEGRGKEGKGGRETIRRGYSGGEKM